MRASRGDTEVSGRWPQSSSQQTYHLPHIPGRSQGILSTPRWAAAQVCRQGARAELLPKVEGSSCVLEGVWRQVPGAPAPKMSPDITKCTSGAKLPPIESHWSRAPFTPHPTQYIPSANPSAYKFLKLSFWRHKHNVINDKLIILL